MTTNAWGAFSQVRHRAGVIGVGSRTVHGEGWARSIAAMPEVALVRVSDADPLAAERTATALGVPSWSGDPRAVLEAEDLDLVVVNSIDHLHAQHVLAALEAGKNVITDKPLAVRTEDAIAVAERAQSRGLKVAVGHTFRFAPHYEFVKARVEAGDLGRLFQVEAGYVHDLRRIWGLTPWRSDPSKPQDPWFGGVTHPVDLARWIGGEVTAVAALQNKASGESEYPPPDNFLLSLKFAGGAVGRVWCAMGIRQRPEFHTFCNAFGDRGSCLANLQQNRVELHLDWGSPDVAGPALMPMPERIDLNAQLIRDFLSAVENGSRPRCDPTEAVATMRVIDAAMESVRTGRLQAVEESGG